MKITRALNMCQKNTNSWQRTAKRTFRYNKVVNSKNKIYKSYELIFEFEKQWIKQ